MFEQAVGLALVAMFYPPALLIAALYLGSARPGRTTVAYVIGGLVIATVVGAAALIAIRSGGLSMRNQHAPRYGLRLGLGVLALIAAAIIYRRKPRLPDPANASKPKKPSLVSRLTTDPKPRSAFGVGVLMFGPSITFIAAVQVVATARASIVATVGAMVLIIALTIAFAWAPLVAYLVAPGKTTRTLRVFDGWLRRHGKTVLVGAIGLIGVLLVIQGITGLA